MVNAEALNVQEAREAARSFLLEEEARLKDLEEVTHPSLLSRLRGKAPKLIGPKQHPVDLAADTIGYIESLRTQAVIHPILEQYSRNIVTVPSHIVIEEPIFRVRIKADETILSRYESMGMFSGSVRNMPATREQLAELWEADGNAKGFNQAYIRKLGNAKRSGIVRDFRASL
jgi:hypothetical protein